MNIQIITDSTSDIPPKRLNDLPITVVPLYITLNGKSYLDNVDLSREEFYNALPESEPYPTTATPAPHQFEEFFEQVAADGADAIISIHISETLSATFQSAQTAAKNFDRIPVRVVDSGNLSMAEGLVVIKAAEAAKAGKSLEEVMSVIEQVIPRTHAFAKLDTIDYLHRGGRMSSIQHSIVSILGIKPILKMNNHVSRMEIARTKSKAFDRVLQVAREALPHAEIFGITHANVPEQVDDLVKELKSIYPDMPAPLISDVTPSLGVHVGPGALCINWVCEPGYQEEKKGLQKWISDHIPGMGSQRDE